MMRQISTHSYCSQQTAGSSDDDEDPPPYPGIVGDVIPEMSDSQPDAVHTQVAGNSGCIHSSSDTPVAAANSCDEEHNEEREETRGVSEPPECIWTLRQPSSSNAGRTRETPVNRTVSHNRRGFVTECVVNPWVKAKMAVHDGTTQASVQNFHNEEESTV